jgi:biotin operon repressor
VLQTQVETLRQRGISWEAIGGALGVSRQAAWERFS